MIGKILGTIASWNTVKLSLTNRASNNWSNCALHYFKKAFFQDLHDKVMFLYHNATPHSSLPVQDYIKSLNRRALSYFTYAPDHSFSKDYMFLWMAYALEMQHFCY